MKKDPAAEIIQISYQVSRIYPDQFKSPAFRVAGLDKDELISRTILLVWRKVKSGHEVQDLRAYIRTTMKNLLKDGLAYSSCRPALQEFETDTSFENAAIEYPKVNEVDYSYLEGFTDKAFLTQFIEVSLGNITVEEACKRLVKSDKAFTKSMYMKKRKRFVESIKDVYSRDELGGLIG